MTQTGTFLELLPAVWMNYTDAVMSYISFCEDVCIPTRTRVSYNNDKPGFTARLKQLRFEKEEAFKSGDKDRFRLAKYSFVTSSGTTESSTEGVWDVHTSGM